MAIDRGLIRQIRALDQYDLRRLQIFIGGLLGPQRREPQDDQPAAGAGKVSYRLEPVMCGKPGCTKCPHGPYWYAYWRQDGKVRSRYIGRELPPGAQV